MNLRTATFNARTFALALAALFILSQLLDHVIWSKVHYQGAIAYHAGEAYEAYHGALNLREWGFRWAGLQDMATAPMATAHPYLYIHHPNFGLYFSYLAQLAGISTFSAQMAASTLFWSGGVIIFVLLVREICGDDLVALASGALVGLDPGAALAYGCNIHRAADFGSAALVMWATVRLLKGINVIRIVWLAIGLLLAMGADYIQFFFLIELALLSVFCLTLPPIRELRLDWRLASDAAPGMGGRWVQRFLTPVIRRCLLIVFLAVAIFGARQLQVLRGAGREAWEHDFLYQVLNRTHNERLYSGDWSKDTTQFYQETSILNPGFAPKNSIATRFAVIGFALGSAIAAFIVGGLSISPSVPITCELIAAFLLTTYVLSCFRDRETHKLGASGTKNQSPIHSSLSQRPGSIFIICILITLIAMAFEMPTYFTQWFPTFRLPFFLGTVIGSIAVSQLTVKWRRGWILGVSLILVTYRLAFLPQALTQVAASGLDHGRYAAGLKSGVTYGNFTSAAISTFSRSTTCVPTVAGFAKLAASGALADPADFVFLLEKDRATNPDYYHPDNIVLLKWGDPSVISMISHSRYFRKTAEGSMYVAFRRVTP